MSIDYVQFDTTEQLFAIEIIVFILSFINSHIYNSWKVFDHTLKFLHQRFRNFQHEYN